MNKYVKNIRRLIYMEIVNIIMKKKNMGKILFLGKDYLISEQKKNMTTPIIQIGVELIKVAENLVKDMYLLIRSYIE